MSDVTKSQAVEAAKQPHPADVEARAKEFVSKVASWTHDCFADDPPLTEFELTKLTAELLSRLPGPNHQGGCQ